MKHKLKIALASALAASSLSLPVIAEEEAKSPHSFDFNIGAYSQYIFRGLTQTNSKPALQGSADYSHESGFYAGSWFSTISWLRDTVGSTENTGNSSTYDDQGHLEVDFYAGFAKEIPNTNIGVDIGILTYYYPGDVRTGFVKANTTEVYGALSYKWVTLKNSWVITDAAWGWGKPSGSTNSSNNSASGTTYTELNASIPFEEVPFIKGTAFEKIAMDLHYGYQNFHGTTLGDTDSDRIDYQDVLVGFSRAFGPEDSYTVGMNYTHSNTSKAAWAFDNRNIGGDAYTFYLNKSF
jgi:uncharacterized protein (TIGR02001 family)